MGVFRPLGSRYVVRELVLDLSPQWNCWQQLYWNNWSLSNTDHQETFAFSFTFMVLKWLFCFTCCWRGVEVSAVRGCCPSRVSSALLCSLPSHLCFSVFGVSVHTALLNFLLPVDEISSKALLVLWLCLLLKMEVGGFFLSWTVGYVSNPTE